ncbi:MAG: signal peptidase I [Desulfurococcaceae archaeon]
MSSRSMVHRNGRRLATTLVLVLIIVAIVVAVKVYLADVPVAVVKGNSMFPLLREGDVVFIVRSNPREIKEGDVIVFWTPDNAMLVIHRVIEVVEVDSTPYYVTKGDNNLFRDVYYPVGVPHSKVVGKVASVGNSVYKIPYMGYITLIFRH